MRKSVHDIIQCWIQNNICTWQTNLWNKSKYNNYDSFQSTNNIFNTMNVFEMLAMIILKFEELIEG